MFLLKHFIRISFLLLFLQGLLVGATIQHIKYKDIQIPVIFEQQNSLPTYNLQLVFQNSGFIQDKTKSGLAVLSAKLLNEGTKESGSIKFAHKLESNAISLHTTSGFETFMVELSSLMDVKNKALDLMKDLLVSPNYSDKTIEKLKTLQIGSLQRKENDFDYIAKVGLKKLLFKKTALENPSGGTIDSINEIDLKDIKKFINNNLTLENLIIVAGGDTNFKNLQKDLAKILPILKTGKKNELESFETSDKSKVETLTKKTEQAYIYFGSPFVIKPSDEEVYIAKIASFILGGSGFGSRLMEEIRVKRGLAYSAYGYISINKTYSNFNGYLQTKLESTDEAKKLVSKIVSDFVKNGVTQKELDSAKNFLSGSEPLRTETLSQRLNRAFMLYYKGLEQDYPSKELSLIENLTLSDLNEYIKSHKEINQLSFSIVRN